MDTFRVLVDLTDLGNKKIGARFWQVMEEREFADVHYIGDVFIVDLNMLFYMVDFKFHGERELNVFKLKHPDEYSILIKENDFYKNNIHRLELSKKSKDYFI